LLSRSSSSLFLASDEAAASSSVRVVRCLMVALKFQM
jgi:hypothetical protein